MNFTQFAGKINDVLVKLTSNDKAILVVPVDALGNQLFTTSLQRVDRATETLPQSAVGNLFTVTGRCLISSIIGEVTVEIQSGTNNIKLISDPTVGTDTDLCATVDIAGDVVGTLYTLTGTLTDAMIASLPGAIAAQVASIVVTGGVIELSASASKTGSIKWTILYIPMEYGAKIESLATTTTTTTTTTTEAPG